MRPGPHATKTQDVEKKINYIKVSQRLQTPKPLQIIVELNLGKHESIEPRNDDNIRW